MAGSASALVLAAGLGTRLRPLTLVRAKPAVPLGGEPLIRHILRSLASQRVRDAVINLHHLPATVTSVVGDGADLGLRVRYSWEQPAVLGSAGGPRQARDLMGEDAFLILNGDTLSDVDLDALRSRHETTGAMVTLAVTPNRQPQRYGGVMLDGGGRVTGFVARGRSAVGSMHFVGVQAARSSAFDNVPAGRPVNSIGEAYDQLLRDRPGSILGFVSDASFLDIGTPGDYVAAHRLVEPTAGSRGSGVRIDPTARVTDSILWDDVVVGAGASVDRCIVTDGVRVAPGAVYHRTILRRDAAEGLIVTPLTETDG